MPKKQTKTAKSRRKPTSKRAPRKAAAKRRSPRAPVPRDPQVVAALSQARIGKLLRAPTLPPKPSGPPGPPMDPPIQLTALTVDTKNQLVMGAPVTLNLQLFADSTGGTSRAGMLALCRFVFSPLLVRLGRRELAAQLERVDQPVEALLRRELAKASDLLGRGP